MCVSVYARAGVHGASNIVLVLLSLYWGSIGKSLSCFVMFGFHIHIVLDVCVMFVWFHGKSVDVLVLGLWNSLK